MQVQQEAWEHLVKFHGNGSTFDLVLDRATTQQMIETLLRPGGGRQYSRTRQEILR